MTSLRLILGDQLTHSLSSLSDVECEEDVILLCEVWEEAKYVKHHKKKIAFLFAAMRHFAEELKAKGLKVEYHKLDLSTRSTSFRSVVQSALNNHQADRIIVTHPGEYRVLEELRTWERSFSVPIEIRDDDRFLCSHNEFESWASGRKELRMEYFYREMRKKYNILMDGDKPEGGKWNYDNENRKPPRTGLNVPKTSTTPIDEITQEVLELVDDKFTDHFGEIEPFFFAVTREGALLALHKFIKERLKYFGDYQDAMIEGEPWMFHSHISFYLNCGLLEPLECVQHAEQAYRDNKAPLNAVEGFVRQIIGWREFVRGLYWLKMPDYKQQNFFSATRNLPSFYWTGASQMNCVRQCVLETKKHAYAHHIQRLMVLGNFALLAGLHPEEVNEWYLIVYADAYEWVELPNVTGMVLFADGGLLASKPYAASGAYINKMSDYCKNCRYKVTKKKGPEACPFNYLYWDFLIRNDQKLRHNPRLSMVYRTLDKMNDEKISAIRDDTKRFFKELDDA